MSERPYTGFYARFLGGFSLSYQGTELPIPANPQTKSMQILLMLLKAGKMGVDRKEFIRFLQGDEGDWEKGMNNFRQRVFLLRKIMARAHFPEGKYIILKDGRYYFSQEYELDSDTAYLDEIILRIRNGPGRENRELEWEYCQNYRGEFLPMLSGEAWATQEGAYYQKWYFECLNHLCEELKKNGEYEKLLELCTTASKLHPYDSWQTVQIDCLMAMNRYQEAVKVYEQASEIFYEELGISDLDKAVIRCRNREGQKYFLANAMTGIKDILKEERTENAAYCCSYPSFLDMYHIICRMEERSRIPSALMICTLREKAAGDGRAGKNDASVAKCPDIGLMKRPDAAPVKHAAPAKYADPEATMEAFRQVLAGGIRSGDVYTRYSSRQFLALLMDASEENGRKAARRLNDRWEETEESRSWTVEFLIERTENPGKEECRDGKEGHVYGTNHQPGEFHLAGPGYLA